ncbi:MAG: DUF1801 domain-containing protein [Rhodospirillaceae bacterium]
MTALFRLSRANKQDPEIDAWLNARAPELAGLVRPWFEKMRSCGEDVREVMHDGCPTACVDDAAFAYVGIYRAHAAVGFFHGAVLHDPARLLRGTGKRMRHVKLVPGLGQAVDAGALDRLIAAAYRDIRLRLASGD